MALREQLEALSTGHPLSMKKWNDFAGRYYGQDQVTAFATLIGPAPRSAGHGFDVFEVRLDDGSTRYFNCDWLEPVSPLMLLADACRDT